MVRVEKTSFKKNQKTSANGHGKKRSHGFIAFVEQYIPSLAKDTK